MGHIKEPNGVTLVVDKKTLTKDVEREISSFIKKSKEKNKDLINKMKKKFEV